MRLAVILPAAGQGKRFAESGGTEHKLETRIAGRSVLERAIDLFDKRPEVSQIIVAVDPDQLDHFRLRWGDKLDFMGVSIVAGGQTERWETVLNALRAVEAGATHVAVHDAARPVTDPAAIDRVFAVAEEHAAVIPAVPCRATLKRAEPLTAAESQPEEKDPLDAILGSAGKVVVERHRVVETLPRDGVWLVQTPQVFERSLLERAYQQITDGKITGEHITDDAGLVETLGEPVLITPGDVLNVKITTREDLDFAAAVAALRSGHSAEEDPLSPKRKFPTWKEMDED